MSSSDPQAVLAGVLQSAAIVSCQLLTVLVSCRAVLWLQGGLRALGQATDGDHSMLSGKPLGGYRCMACDRPLTTLDSRPGPYLPSGQLPVSLASGAEMAAGGAAALGKVCMFCLLLHEGQISMQWQMLSKACTCKALLS